MWSLIDGGPRGGGDTFSKSFFFFIFKKIKILKIYVYFEKFQKYHLVALWGGRQALDVFFFFKFATRSMAEKK